MQVFVLGIWPHCLSILGGGSGYCWSPDRVWHLAAEVTVQMSCSKCVIGWVWIAQDCTTKTTINLYCCASGLVSHQIFATESDSKPTETKIKVSINQLSIFKNVFCLNRIDAVFEFPRPLMPNTILVGGLNCHVRNPLPDVSNDFKSSHVIHILDHLSSQTLVEQRHVLNYYYF